MRATSSILSIVLLALVVLRASGAQAQEVPAAAISLETTTETRLDLEWVGWPLVAAGAVFLGGFAATYARLGALNQDADFFDYRRMAGSMPGVTNACDAAATDPSALAAHARSVCSEGSVLEPLGYVLLVTGAASIVAGLTLVLVDANVSDSPVSVAVGPGGVSLHGSPCSRA